MREERLPRTLARQIDAADSAVASIARSAAAAAALSVWRMEPLVRCSCARASPSALVSEAMAALRR